MLKPYHIFTISIVIILAIISIMVFTPLQKNYIRTEREYTIEFQYKSNAPVDILKITNSTYRASWKQWIERGTYLMKIAIEGDPNLFLMIHFNNKTKIFNKSATMYIKIDSGLFVAIGYITSTSGYAKITLERVSWP